MRREEFERLFEEHAGPLFGFLVYRTGDRAQAEDLVATTFERALRARRRFDRRRGSEKSWLYAIALNCLRDEARRKDVEVRALERVEIYATTPESGWWTEAIAERDSLVDALRTLPAEEREAVAMRFGGEMTVPEIARALGVPLTTAEGRVYRGLRKLRECLDP